MRYILQPNKTPNDNPPEYYEIELPTHWTPEQLLELAKITPEGWDRLFFGWLSYLELEAKKSKPHKPVTVKLFSEYLTELLTLAVDMTAKGLSRSEYIKLLEGK